MAAGRIELEAEAGDHVPWAGDGPSLGPRRDVPENRKEFEG